MESILFIIALLIGGIATWQISSWRHNVQKRKRQELIKMESSVLLERIEKVFKVILAEGYFTEIYDHNSRKNFWGLFETHKKALIIAKAKVAMGFDFSKLKWRVEEGKKKMILEELPKAEVLSIDPEYKFYDIDNGFLHKFKTADYTHIVSEARELMLQKAMESDLPASANRQLELMIQQLAASMEWELKIEKTSSPRKSLTDTVKDFLK
ncbi:DUF4230 domain-containing protein [Marinilongibacter aquaticus]|uniref:DUF4230 domain-containing protein n=1 Tax=Marinilongibacter aquaticus TaxID=2975157 RepID=UPI0021BCFD3D|nr:DUF4230 domain-containing protein [Marinilongibacter aquaticus]UBM60483.1 DUF4230 domain-containing protein [Marinilongibacter aquaticus]